MASWHLLHSQLVKLSAETVSIRRTPNIQRGLSDLEFSPYARGQSTLLPFFFLRFGCVNSVAAVSIHFLSFRSPSHSNSVPHALSFFSTRTDTQREPTFPPPLQFPPAAQPSRLSDGRPHPRISYVCERDRHSLPNPTAIASTAMHLAAKASHLHSEESTVIRHNSG